MSVLVNNNGTLVQQDASAVSQLAAVDTENILGGGAGATTNGQTLVDQLAADDVQAQTDIGQIKTDLSDQQGEIDAILNVYGSKNLLNTDGIGQYGIGLSISVADDGTMTITGTEANASGGGYKVMFDLPAGTYIFSGLISGGSSSAFIDVYENQWTNRTIINENGAEKTLTFTTDTDHVFRFFAGYNATVNVVIKPMLRDSRIKDSTYVPYAPTNRECMSYSANGVLGAKNLLPITAVSQTVNGITWTVYRDSRGRVTSIVANGTATARSNLSTDVVAEQEHLNQYGQQRYILSGCPSGGSASTYYLYLHPGKTNGSWNPAVADVGNGVSFEYDGQTKIFCACTIMSGVTVSNLVYKPMIRLASDPDDTYVPYAMTNMELTEGNIKYPVKLTSSNNINDIKTPGFYYWGDSLPTNLPGTLYYSSMSVQRLWTDGKIIQIIQRNGEIYTHAWTGSAWNGWYKFTGTAV